MKKPLRKDTGDRFSDAANTKKKKKFKKILYPLSTEE